MGDGLLVEFASVVDALRCAVEMQRAKAARSGVAGPPDGFRIGINLGDIIVEGDDIHGDGVNIADRLQALASRRHRDLRHRLRPGAGASCRSASPRSASSG